MLWYFLADRLFPKVVKAIEGLLRKVFDLVVAGWKLFRGRS